jgi:hypothetical protein
VTLLGPKALPHNEQPSEIGSMLLEVSVNVMNRSAFTCATYLLSCRLASVAETEGESKFLLDQLLQGGWHRPAPSLRIRRRVQAC